MSMPDSIPEEMLSAYLDGELSSEEHEDVERALEHDAELRALLADLERIRTEIQKLPRHALSGDFAKRVTEAAVASAKGSGRAVTPNSSSTIPSSSVPRPRTYASRVRMVVGTIATAAAIFIAISALPPQDPQAKRKQVVVNTDKSPSRPAANAPNAMESDSQALAESDDAFETVDDFATNEADTFATDADRFSFGDDNGRFEDERLQRSLNRGRDSANAITARSRFHNRSTESVELGLGGATGGGLGRGDGGLADGVQELPVSNAIEFAADAQPEGVRPEEILSVAPPEVPAATEAAFAPSGLRLKAPRQEALSLRSVAQDRQSLNKVVPRKPQTFDAILYVSLNAQETTESLTKNDLGLQVVPLRRENNEKADKQQKAQWLSDAETLREQHGRDELLTFSESRLSELNVPKNAELIVLEGPAADIFTKVQQLGPRLDARRSELSLMSSKAGLYLELKSGGREQAESTSSMARTPAAVPKTAAAARSLSSVQVDSTVGEEAPNIAAVDSVDPALLKARRPSEQQSNHKQALPDNYLRVLLVVQPNQQQPNQ